MTSMLMPKFEKNFFRPVIATFTAQGIGRDTVDVSYIITSFQKIHYWFIYLRSYVLYLRVLGGISIMCLLRFYLPLGYATSPMPI